MVTEYDGAIYHIMQIITRDNDIKSISVNSICIRLVSERDVIGQLQDQSMTSL